MTRVKRRTVSRNRHKKVLKMTQRIFVLLESVHRILAPLKEFAYAAYIELYCTVNVRYNDARLSDNHDITTKSRKTVFLH